MDNRAFSDSLGEANRALCRRGRLRRPRLPKLSGTHLDARALCTRVDAVAAATRARGRLALLRRAFACAAQSLCFAAVSRHHADGRCRIAVRTVAQPLGAAL